MSKKIKTRIADCCSSSTECSDHSLKKIQIFFQVSVFFQRGVTRDKSMGADLSYALQYGIIGELH